MRLYHTILLLSACIVSINAAFQAVALHRLGQVRESVQEYSANWMPTVMAANELEQLVSEFRQLELRYALAATEKEMASLARRMSRQGERIRQGEERLRALPHTPEENAAFEVYFKAKETYLEGHRQILEAMTAGESLQARDAARKSALSVAAMLHALDDIEFINAEAGRRAEEAAQERHERTVRAMLFTMALSILAALGGAFFAARRISGPIATLARHMAEQGGDVPTPPPADPPAWSVKEVAVLYLAFRALSRKLAASMERLSAMAVTDQLTGVHNRRKLMADGAKALDICRRGNAPCSALMLDIDFFKKVNDTHGHAAGDAVLKTVARTLGEGIRASDILARYGGEEFVIIAPNSGLGEAVQLAGRLRQAVEANATVTDAGEVKVTVSVGAASAGAGTTGLEHLLALADAALYRAKKNGRNRVETQDVADAA